MSLTRLPDLLNLDPFDDSLRQLMRPWRVETESVAPTIRLDVKEQDGSYCVSAEIPGVRKEDIDVRIDGRQVTLSAEVRREREEGPGAEDGARVLRSERSYGYANRSFTLGAEVDETKAQARYENGVLQLTLPKKASAQARRLSID